jgi:hypothetical protein
MTFIPSKPSSKDNIINEQKPLVNDIDYNNKENKDKVLRFLSQISASYMSEISWQLLISDYDTKNAIFELMNYGLVERVPVLSYGEHRLIARVPEMSRINQGGIENFSKKKWVAISEKGKEYLGITTTKISKGW